jgi:hypothetical protein
VIPQHQQSEAFRKAIRGSTDPQWVREQFHEEQFSPAFIIVAACVGALAFYGVFAAIASI